MENRIHDRRILRNRTYYTGPIRERDRKSNGLTLRSFFGDKFQFFVNVVYNFKDEQVSTSAYSNRSNLEIQWIWANSGKRVDNSYWQKSGKWKNHPEDQGRESGLKTSPRPGSNG